MKRILILTLGLALTLPLQAGKKHAGGKDNPKPNQTRIFKKKDKDNDGFLSKEEFIGKAKKAERLEKAFAKKDKDGDGKLSRAEFTGKKKAANKNKAGKNNKAPKKGQAKATKKGARQKK